ncbi:hypothetical protein DNTS_017516 [Danionella cerebrum]|uniref:Uncharacterized protein n=1 Tax=Danionella cerebrum TaxID=2873325 RepID=A0A553R8F5_9TELE|nr:hypothetical protein DNTS_017516 [Danionella translucida]
MHQCSFFSDEEGDRSRWMFFPLMQESKPLAEGSTVASNAQLEESSFLKNESKKEIQGERSSSSAVHRASEMLQDLGRLKNEMRNLLQTADAFPVQTAKANQNSGSSHPTPSTTTPPLPTTPISMLPEPREAVGLNRPSILRSIQPPSSMFEDAGLVLRQVRQSRKVLEENLEAIMRASDGEVLHAQIEALSKNRQEEAKPNGTISVIGICQWRPLPRFWQIDFQFRYFPPLSAGHGSSRGYQLWHHVKLY